MLVLSWILTPLRCEPRKAVVLLALRLLPALTLCSVLEEDFVLPLLLLRLLPLLPMLTSDDRGVLLKLGLRLRLLLTLLLALPLSVSMTESLGSDGPSTRFRLADDLLDEAGKSVLPSSPSFPACNVGRRLTGMALAVSAKSNERPDIASQRSDWTLVMLSISEGNFSLRSSVSTNQDSAGLLLTVRTIARRFDGKGMSEPPPSSCSVSRSFS